VIFWGCWDLSWQFCKHIIAFCPSSKCSLPARGEQVSFNPGFPAPRALVFRDSTLTSHEQPVSGQKDCALTSQMSQSLTIPGLPTATEHSLCGLQPQPGSILDDRRMQSFTALFNHLLENVFCFFFDSMHKLSCLFLLKFFKFLIGT
jgi:hypothetical protein